MCGIAGVATEGGGAPDAALLDRLAAALAHRGPDGEGRFAGKGIGLAHTRLSIIDLDTGAQPIQGPRETAIAANGEIYNYVELREQLGVERFKTRSDSETALQLYADTGTEFGGRLRGMYAIAIADEMSNRLVLARDPFGIKPLYYSKTADGIAFASEPQSLIASGLLAPKIDPLRRGELLQLQFTTGAPTIFAGIERLLPGETLVIEQGRIVGRSRQSALPAVPAEKWAEDEAVAQLDAALMESVEMHQRADVPYGLFLSGGVDSSSVLACMRDLNDKPVQAFTAGFSGTGATDEREAARRIADAAGAEFHSVDVSEEDFWTLLPAIAAALDDPAADYAVIPTYKLGALAHAQGLKVVLSGEGGDELFAGYGRYRRLLRPWFLGGRPMRQRGILEELGLLRRETDGWRSGLAANESAAAQAGWTKLQAAQAADCADWLPHDLLIKLDRCLMAHGVEGRTPFLDPQVADVAMRLPDGLKIRGRLGKYILRKWLEWKLPEAQPFAPKRGFTVPVAEWIAGRARVLAPLMAAQPGIAEICKPDAVAQLFNGLEGNPARRNGQAAWVLLFYALWHRRHILGLAPQGDVMDCLAAI